MAVALSSMGLHRKQRPELRRFWNWRRNWRMNACFSGNNYSDYEAYPEKLPALGGSCSFLRGHYIREAKVVKGSIKYFVQIFQGGR
jgi:hypothetical protein